MLASCKRNMFSPLPNFVVKSKLVLVLASFLLNPMVATESLEFLLRDGNWLIIIEMDVCLNV